MPDVPTIAEAGVPGYEMSPWIGVFVPAGTPKDAHCKLNSEINKALKAPDVSQIAVEQALDAWAARRRNSTRGSRSDYEKYAKLIKLTGAKVD